jgi:hypothetical protein
MMKCIINGRSCNQKAQLIVLGHRAAKNSYSSSLFVISTSLIGADGQWADERPPRGNLRLKDED